MPLMPCELIEITIPGEPVAQGRPKATTVNGHVRMYDPKKSSDFKQLVSFYAAQKAPGVLLDGQLIINVIVFRKIPTSKSKTWIQKAIDYLIRPTTKPDCSNYLKGIEDALNGIIYTDDSRIVTAIVQKVYSQTPKTLIQIKEMKESRDIIYLEE